MIGGNSDRMEELSVANLYKMPFSSKLMLTFFCIYIGYSKTTKQLNQVHFKYSQGLPTFIIFI